MENSLKKIGEYGVICLLLIFANIICQVYRFCNETELFTKISIVIHFVTLLCGVAYVLKGFKKVAADYYKWYMLLFSISLFLSSISTYMQPQSYPIFRITGIIAFALSLALVFAIDFGKNNTFMVGSIISLIYLLNMVLACFTKVSFEVCLDSLDTYMLSLISCMFILAKYNDKQSRGSK